MNSRHCTWLARSAGAALQVFYLPWTRTSRSPGSRTARRRHHTSGVPD